MTVDERARAGLFLAMQYPVEVPGVSVANFLRTAKTALDGEAPKLRTWVKEVNSAMERVEMDPEFAQRNVNEGFSGGEKKRHEIVQLELLNPRFAILDETDSGLDIDALRVVADGVNRFSEQGDRGVLLITHYTRILRYITPDFVHVFVAGRVAERGRPGAGRPAGGRGLRPVRAAARSTLSAQTRPGPPMSTRPPVPVTDVDEVEPADDGSRSTSSTSGPTSRSWSARPDGRPLVYLDSANTSQKPRSVVEAIEDHYLQPQRQRRPGHAPAGGGGDRGVRGCAGHAGPVRRGGALGGDRLHQERLRGPQPRVRTR